jgi:hypothetical protein
MSDSEVEEKKARGRPRAKKDAYMTLCERFDQDKLNHIVQNEAVYRSQMRARCFEDGYNPFVVAAKYLAKSEGGVVSVKYKQNASAGRFYAMGSMSLQSLPREVRHTIAGEFYNDIDIKNAHPVILAHMCEERGIPCRYLNRYNRKRDQFLAEISDDKDLAKVVVLSMINGGKKAKGALREPPEWLGEFAKELSKIHSKFARDKAFKAHKAKRVEAGIDYNHQASYMNTLLCDFENKILQTIYRALGSPKDAVLCFDGLMVRKGLEFDLEALEVAVMDLEIEIKLVVKPMNEGWVIGDVEAFVPAMTNCFDFTDPYDWGAFHKEYNGQDHDSVIDSVIDKYPRVVAHILDGEGSYIKKMEDGQVCMVKSLKSSDLKLRPEKGPPITMSDVMSWRSNSFSRIVCKLTNCPKSEFNVWSGFQAIRVVPAEQDSEGLALMKSFIMETWANGNQVHYNYIISWFAGLVTNLNSINKIALAMVSLQGGGKGTLIEFMELILRSVNVVSAPGIEKITGRFNTILQGKRLVNINEMSSTKDEFRSNFDKIKSFITDPTIMIEPKGVNPYIISNISNYVLFTQHRDAIVVEESDRRYAIFDMGTAHVNDNDYFGRIRALCFNQDVANQFYTYLLDFPAVPLNKIPDTELRREMMSVSKPTPLKFLDAINEDSDLKESIMDGETQVKSTVLYTKYREWCAENGERNILTSTKFGTVIGQKLRKIHKRDGYYYELM